MIFKWGLILLSDNKNIVQVNVMSVNIKSYKIIMKALAP